MTPPITIAVVSWNTRDALRRCLRSMQHAIRSNLAAVWVVDNGSDDGSPELVRNGFPDVTLVQAQDNLGYGPAVNLVAERTATPWIAASNADVALEPTALAALLAAGEDDPRAGCLVPKLVLPNGAPQPSVQPFPTVTNSLLMYTGIARLSPAVRQRLCLPGAWNADAPAIVDWAAGAFMLVRRSAWDATGGFAPDQWLYAEDLDLCWRLRRAGWTTRYEPGAVVHHELSEAAAQAFGTDDTFTDRWLGARYAWIARRRGTAIAWATGAVDSAGAAARAALLRARARTAGAAARADAAKHEARAIRRCALRSRREFRAFR